MRLRWLGGEHRYRRAWRVTRVAVKAEGVPSCARDSGARWAVGPAVLLGDEPIELIRSRLGRRSSWFPPIVAGGDRAGGRERAAGGADPRGAPPGAGRRSGRPQRPAFTGSGRTPEPPPLAAPRVWTGIERTLIEQRLAASELRRWRPRDRPGSGSPAEAVPGLCGAGRGATGCRSRGRARDCRTARTRRRERARWERPDWLAVPEPGAPGQRAHRLRSSEAASRGSRSPSNRTARAADRREPASAVGDRAGRTGRRAGRVHRSQLVSAARRTVAASSVAPGACDPDHPRVARLTRRSSRLRRSAQSKTR